MRDLLNVSVCCSYLLFGKVLLVVVVVVDIQTVAKMKEYIYHLGQPTMYVLGYIGRRFGNESL